MQPGRSPTLSRKEIRRRVRRLVFGLLVAGAAVALLLGGLSIYAGMWPPALVVESGSMQHSETTSEIGVLDTGDLAVIQAVHSTQEIVTYLAGRAAGYTSFGDFGDVIVFADPEPNETAVLIHRAFAYVVQNASGGFDVPELAALPRSDWWGTSSSGTNASSPRGLRSLTLRSMGWRHDLTISWNLTSLGASYPNNGFLTFGDRNLYRTTKRTDPWILPAAYVIARARGEIPWIGLLRLSVARSPEGCCAAWGSTDPEVGAPGNSWLALELLLVILFATPIAADLVWRRLPWIRRKHRAEVAPEPARPAAETGPQGNEAADERSPGEPILASDFRAWLDAIDARIQRIRDTFGHKT